MTASTDERWRRWRALSVTSALAITVIGVVALFGRGGGNPRHQLVTSATTPVGQVSPPHPTSSAWQAPFERSVREGNERSLTLIEDALSQARQRSDVNPAYVAELERARAALKRPPSHDSAAQR